MTQTQLLALDTILPTVLGIIGLVFLAGALWPTSASMHRELSRSALLGLVGAVCVAVGVWLWLGLVSAAGRVAAPAPAPSASTASKPEGSTPATSKPSASPAPSSSSAASASPGASSPAASVTSTPQPTPTVALTPVPTVGFQPENTNQHAAVVGVESFERGSMLYRDDLKQIYVLTPDKQFKGYADTWDESKPDFGSLTPEPGGKFRPRRGFGWLWNSNAEVKQALGLALTPEQGFTGTISGDGTSTTIRADVTYVFNRDGTWALK